MDSVREQMLDDLKYKLRNKVDERNRITSSIKPSGVLVAESLIATTFFGVASFAICAGSFVTYNVGHPYLFSSLIGVGIAVASYTTTYSIAKANEDEKRAGLVKKQQEIEELITVIKAQEELEKQLNKNDDKEDTNEKKIIREEDFLDFYLDDISKSNEQFKVKKIGQKIDNI